MAKHLEINIAVEWSSKKMQLSDYKELENQFFVRTSSAREDIEKAFQNVSYVELSDATGEVGFVTETMTEADYEKAAAALDVIQMIRVA